MEIYSAYLLARCFPYSNETRYYCYTSVCVFSIALPCNTFCFPNFPLSPFVFAHVSLTCGCNGGNGHQLSKQRVSSSSLLLLVIPSILPIHLVLMFINDDQHIKRQGTVLLLSLYTHTVKHSLSLSLCSFLCMHSLFLHD